MGSSFDVGNGSGAERYGPGLVAEVEEGLGPERLSRLRADPDSMQQFWLGVLKAARRADPGRDRVAFLISNGYGEVRNGRRSDRTWRGMRACRSCGAVLSYRSVTCPRCGSETEAMARVQSFEEWHGPVGDADRDFKLDVESFVSTLSGLELEVARRWLVMRYDLTSVNYLKRIAQEVGRTPARVAQVVKRLRLKFRAWY